jgi:hypothetical protein
MVGKSRDRRSVGTSDQYQIVNDVPLQSLHPGALELSEIESKLEIDRDLDQQDHPEVTRKELYGWYLVSAILFISCFDFVVYYMVCFFVRYFKLVVYYMLCFLSVTDLNLLYIIICCNLNIA